VSGSCCPADRGEITVLKRGPHHPAPRCGLRDRPSTHLVPMPHMRAPGTSPRGPPVPHPYRLSRADHRPHRPIRDRLLPLAWHAGLDAYQECPAADAPADAYPQQRRPGHRNSVDVGAERRTERGLLGPSYPARRRARGVPRSRLWPACVAGPPMPLAPFQDRNPGRGC
jgi:hypothetical protein